MSDEETFYQKHSKYSKLIQYPPFSISLKKSRSFTDDLLKEENRVLSEKSDGNENAFSRSFSTLEVKWQDDIDEAILYQKRHGVDTVAARKSAIELNNLDENDDDVPLFF
jgi:hypothetical protein